MYNIEITSLFDLEKTIAAKLFEGRNYPWEVLRDIKGFILELGATLDPEVFDHPAEDIWIAKSAKIAPSASLNETRFGLYEPSHGSAPDIAGQDIANPIATILSAAMMLSYTFDLDREAEAIRTAVQEVLTEGYRTVDIMSEGCTQVGTVKMGDLICERIR